ncbi:MAG TPA: glycosyltransferase [Gemmatimonadales bacterium]|nr:glycosyltransferase [Gemmatimonadales bacterium]
MLTVLFATHNGVRTLPDVLEAYLRLRTPSGGWRLVSVDNASTDGTSAVLAGFSARLPLTVRQEPRLGKNGALNAALDLVDGDLAVFTDDDVFPHPDWLVRLRQAADDHPDYSVFGGTVLPRWESPPPSWVLDDVPLGPAFTLTGDLPEGPTTAHTVFGPNMAVRSAVFAAGTRFDTRIGPRGTDYAMGSETELVRRLLASGHQAWHVPAAQVEHFIRTGQLDPEWIVRRAVRFGRGQYRLDPDAASPRWAGAPRWMWKDLIVKGLRAAGRSLRSDRRGFVRARWELAYRWGQVVEARALQGDR